MWLTAKKARSRSVINIIYYHGVGNEHNLLKSLDLTISTETFKEHILFLKNNYTILSLNQYLQLLYSNEYIKNAVVITFDDAYKNLLRYAIPLLIEYKLSATINVISGLVGNKRLFWRSKLNYIMELGLGKEYIGIIKKHYKIQEYANLHEGNILSWTKENYSNKIQLSCQEVFYNHSIDEEELAGEAELFWDISDFDGIDKELISFGNHTHTHPVLARLNKEDQKKEILKCKRFLNDHLGISSPPFSIPFGTGKHYFSDISVKLVKESGHSCILLCDGGQNNLSSDKYSLSRKLVAFKNVKGLKYFLEQA